MQFFYLLSNSKRSTPTKTKEIDNLTPIVWTFQRARRFIVLTFECTIEKQNKRPSKVESVNLSKRIQVLSSAQKDFVKKPYVEFTRMGWCLQSTVYGPQRESATRAGDV